MNQNTKVVYLYKLLGRVISTRQAAQIVTEFTSTSKELNCLMIDFRHVEAISRSFADELLKQKEKLQAETPPILVEFVNVSNMPETIIRAVADARLQINPTTKTVNKTDEIKQISFDRLLQLTI